jgi:NAD(P)-dependent dehydrogenase (short-subunit alcohol dehydrogenase family)
LEFAKAGADVVVASRRLSVLEKVAEEVTALGRRSLAVQTDISRKTDVDNMVQRVMDEFGVIDILVNNVGIIVRAPLLEHSEEDWDKVIDTDLKGYFLCCRAVGTKMVERKKGNIINIASVAAITAETGKASYCVSKAGVVMLTKVLARELASYNIRVNAIAPGLVRTEMSRSRWSDPETLKQITAEIPLGRVAEPSDIGSVAVFLASDASRHITGSTIAVDGGQLA